MNERQEQMRQYLLERHRWVSTEEIVSHFGLPDDRPLRYTNGKPGLCSLFACSNNKGFKHVAHATPNEYVRFKHRIRGHGISELVRIRECDKERSRMLRTIKHHTFEKQTGQGVLALT